MKNIEDRLRSVSREEPKRELSSHFTASILAELRTNPTSPKENVMRKLLHKPAVATLAILAALTIGSTSYAATDGFTKPFDLKNIFGYSEQFETNGNKVLSVDTHNCSPGAMYQTDSSEVDQQRIYLRLLNDMSKQASDRALSYLQGYCEYISGRPKFIEQMSSTVDVKNLDTMPVITSGKVASIDGRKIRIDSEYRLGDNTTTIQKYSTNLSVTNDTKFDGVPNQQATSRLKVGDVVDSLVIDVNAGDELNLLYAKVLSKNESFFLDLHTDIAGNIERVIPCKENSKRFCNWRTEMSKPLDKKRLGREARDAYEFVSDAYTNYIQQNVSEEGSLSAMESFTAKVTPPFATSLKFAFEVDPIVCAQNISNSLVFSSPVKIGSEQTITVLSSFSENTTQPMPIAEVSYDTSQKKISSITCASDLRI